MSEQDSGTGAGSGGGAPERFAVDLTNCDREPIHLLGSVQSFGFLVAVSRDWTIQQVSANSGDWLGGAPDRLIGRPLAEVMSHGAVHALRNRMQYLREEDMAERLFGQPVVEGGAPLDLAIHLSGGQIVIEGEAAAPAETAPASETVRAMVARLRAVTDLERLLEEAARLLQALTGYDRVMVYRFDEDDSGEVVAQSLRGGMDSFLGQRFPASDIPRQARLLYLRNWTRIIGDVEAEPVPVVPARNPAGAPLDLSMSVLRSVSPIHLEYLRNMGLRGSLSVSLVVDGRLWGLLACHHRDPLVVPLSTRTAAELFAQVFSLLLESRERDRQTAYDARAQSLHRRLIGALATDASTVQNIASYFDEMREILDCDGVGIWLDGAATLSGATPEPQAFERLIGFLCEAAGERLYATHHLCSVWPAAEALLPDCAGLLAVPISRRPRDYLVFFRREIAGSVTWAGDPAKPAEPGPHGPNGPRLTPRKSFEAWQEVVQGQSRRWSANERRFAEALRVTILEVVLRVTEAAERERENARQRQELLIAELNHRVRNILALMRAIVGQSREGVDNVAAFASVLGERIQALARAHDQITRDAWGPAPLRSLIEAETSAYLGHKAGRVRLGGPEVLLQPQAFSTLALVVHELVTNAATHGSLSGSSGSIAVEWELEPGGGLAIRWQEMNGPPVQAPQRRGFGSTIIERSVPYDLHGEAEISYGIGGLSARFLVPTHHILPGAPEEQAERAAAQGGGDAPLPASGGRALVVEDNMIVAMEAEDILRELGFGQTESVASVATALQQIEAARPDFALLDVNLGRESSFPVADRLSELGVPFVFATGYGDNAAVPPAHAERPRLSKPFNADSFRQAFGTLWAGGASAAVGTRDVGARSAGAEGEP